MAYNLKLGTANAALVILFVAGFLSISRTDFVRFGPSEKIVFAGYIIDTWLKWAYVMCFSIVSQVSICINVNTLQPFITNVIQDHKSTKILSDAASYGVVALKTSYDWILGILNTNLWVTMQVQFLLTGLVADLVVTCLMTRRFLSEKKRDVLLPK